jgi:predicted phosphodiesterase
MRLAIISDTHSNFQALQAVLADIDGQNIEGIISLGDNVGYGPQPEEVISTLKDRHIPSVLGNHEHALNNESYYQRLNPPAQFSLDINRRLMKAGSLAFCKTLPTFILRYGARFVHGSPPESVTSYLWDPSEVRMARLFISMPETMCFFGHTHIMSCYVADGSYFQKLEVEIGTINLRHGCRYIINPGSVGQPRDLITFKAKYGIWDQDAKSFEFRQTAYDVATTKKLLREYNFPESNALRLG